MSLFVSVADIEVACTKYEGVDAVKRALRKGLEFSTEAMPIKVGTVYLVLVPALYRGSADQSGYSVASISTSFLQRPCQSKWVQDS